MATQRMVKTSIWRKSRKFKQCNPLERLLFLFLITNEDTELCGAYELDLDEIARMTGLEAETQIPAMLERLEAVGLALYRDGWVIIPRYKDLQAVENPKVRRGMEASLAKLPAWVCELLTVKKPEFEIVAKAGTGNAKRLRVIKRDGSKCVKCGATEDLHVHHIVPRSQGGSHDESNLITYCAGCHNSWHTVNDPMDRDDDPIQRITNPIPDSDSDSDNDSDNDDDSEVYSDPAAPVAPPEHTDPVIQAYRSELERYLPATSWPRVSEQYLSLKRLAEMTRTTAPATPIPKAEAFAAAVVEKFAALKKAAKHDFWKRVAFDPISLERRFADVVQALADDHEHDTAEMSDFTKVWLAQAGARR